MKRAAKNTVRCDGQWPGCRGTGAEYIDEKGYAYCGTCGPARRTGGVRCRRLHPYEQWELQAGRCISYEVKPASFYRTRCYKAKLRPESAPPNAPTRPVPPDRPVPQLKIPEAAWAASGDADDKRLFAVVNINGCLFHGEALPVREDPQFGIGDYADAQLDRLGALTDATSPYATLAIAGKDHVVFFAPFED